MVVDFLKFKMFFILVMPYVLVSFKDKNESNEFIHVDGLPREWVHTSNNECYAFYPEPPYTNQQLKNIKEKIKNKDKPSMDWGTYEVVIKGRASKNFYINYEELSYILLVFNFY